MSKYEFKDSNGEHLHTLDDKPLIGTSTVISKAVAKPLTWWAVGEGLKTLGWTPITEERRGKRVAVNKEKRKGTVKEWLDSNFNTLVESNDIVESWLSLLDTAYYAHSKTVKKAAKDGTDLHARLETYVKACIDKNDGAPIAGKSDTIQEFIDWAVENVEKFLWSEMHCFSKEHWVGGITDAGARLKNGKVAIIDFKSSKAAYNSQFWQIGGYQLQIAENGGYNASGEKVMEPIDADTHIIIPFGAPEFYVDIRNDTQGVHQGAFLAALTIYNADNV